MIISNQTLSKDEMTFLLNLKESRWQFFTGNGMTDSNFAWGEIFISTSNGGITISLEQEVLDISGGFDEYPTLHVRAQQSEECARADRFYQGRDEQIRNIWIIREELSRDAQTQADFTNTADIGIIFQLSTMFVAILRTTHLMDAFSIQFTNSETDIAFADTVSEWEGDLFTQHSLKRDWIEVFGNGISGNARE